MQYIEEISITCDNCDKEHFFDRKYKRRFCSDDCRIEFRHKEYLRIRNEFFKYLGDKCVKCGFSDPRALQIDHVLGGGNQEVRRLTSWVARYKMMFTYPPGERYQLLCANCNWIKRQENGEHFKRHGL